MADPLASFLLLSFLVRFFVFSSATSSGLEQLNFPATQSELSQLFEDWIQRSGKNYGNGTVEKQARFETFKANVHYIQQRNREQSSYTLGLTSFMDRTLEELKEKRIVGGLNGGLQRASDAVGTVEAGCNITALPKEFDWRTKGVVTPVKNQGACGSCWAFAAAAAMESAHAISSGKLLDLSEMELVSCVYDHSGCDGGLMDDAFRWVISNGGIDSDADYPYMVLNNTPSCDWTKVHRNKVVKISNYSNVQKDNEAEMLCAISQRPIIVRMHANMDFVLYKEGVFDGGKNCSYDFAHLNHEVLLIGWGSNGLGADYWIAKNSWGTSWGMGGYTTIQRNTHIKHGVCGTNNAPSYPLP